jgi:thymidine phosphorylase
MYALRDVTATVGSVPLIASSVMSKKLAGGASTILLDVKTGSGAFMKDLEAARELARACVDLGRSAGRTTGALITDMSQPLSAMIGNAIEVREVIEVLRGERPGRFCELCLGLTAHLAWFSGVAADEADARERARRALESGAALERFRARRARSIRRSGSSCWPRWATPSRRTTSSVACSPPPSPRHERRSGVCATRSPSRPTSDRPPNSSTT